MGDWTKELPDYKALRRDTENVRPVPNSKKKPRPWKVKYLRWGKEFVVHRSASKEAAEAWIEKQSRNYYHGKRVLPQALIDKQVERAKESAALYRIEPPNV